MYKILYIFLFIFPLFSAAQTQIRGKIIDSKTKEPLAFANVMLDATHGTVSDFDGNFNLEIPNHVEQILISYIGYQRKTLKISPETKYYKIELNPISEALKTVVISTKYEDPVIKLMRRIIKAKKKNDYRKKISKYAFVKYYKFLVTANYDSIDGRLDSIYEKDKLVKIDSSLFEFKKELKEKDMFLMESLTKVNSGYGKEKNKVIATRTAGLKNPMYEVLALQIANQNVYDDNYKFLFKEYLGPLTNLSLKQYQYEIEDTISMQHRDVYVILYKNTKKPLISGKLFIDKQSLAIAKMTLNTYKAFELITTHHFTYMPVYDVWFPQYSTMNIKKAGNKNGLAIDGVITVTSKTKKDKKKHTNQNNVMDYLYAMSINKIMDVRIGNHYADKIKYDLQIAPDAHRKTEDFWTKYTGKRHTKRELNTYKFVDSIAKKEKVDEKINFYRKLSQGYYAIGFMDLDFARFINYNRYESVRIQLGGKTNEKLSDRFFVSAYAAYGFKDKDVKYSARIDWKLRHLSRTFLHVSYLNDLRKSAAFTEFGNNILDRSLLHLSHDKYFMEKGYEIGLSHLLSPDFKTNINFKKYDIISKYQIPFHLGAIEFQKADFVIAELNIDFQPFSKFFLMPSGRKVIKDGYPKFSLHIEKSIPSLQIDTRDFLRMDFQTLYIKKYLNKNHTDAMLRIGAATKGTPLSHLYSPNSNGFAASTWYKRITLGNNFAFETMNDMEFADNFVLAFHLKHTFTKLKISAKNRFDLSILGRASWGMSFDGNKYLGIKSLKNAYYETGVELDKLFAGFGMGFYYRLGAYAYAKPMDNFAFRLTYSLPHIFK